MIDGVVTKVGTNKGPVVAIFGGVHGNERIGVEVVRTLAKQLEIDAGVVYLVEANPQAIQENVRAIGKNLNRCFIRNEQAEDPEDIRAQELMDLLDVSDVLIDIHASNTPGSTPFTICEKEAYALAELTDFEIISSGWDAIEPGAADGYMHQRGKAAVCLECGFAEDTAVHIEETLHAVRRMLVSLGMIESLLSTHETKPKQYMHVYKAVTRVSSTYTLARPFSDFEKLVAGEEIARDGDTVYTAKEGDFIVFARDNPQIGGEAFILGRA